MTGIYQDRTEDSAVAQRLSRFCIAIVRSEKARAANRDFVAASAGGPQSRARLDVWARLLAASGRTEDAAKTAAAWATYDRSGAARHWRRPLTRRNGISTDLQHWFAIVVA